MISIIICSRDSGALKEVSGNIEETIGVPYEIIAIDNSRNQYSIFDAYNLGAEQSTFDHLCFMHEDILYHTPHWGSAVIKT
ncbi:MAG: glycosyltransferase family protein, partial [Deltaproteobacteria bacterium]|nr:glycosyltransferase family protein [Deltaproteobacteria bacterium]